MLLPWTDHQAFVLKAKVPKFTVQVPAIWTTPHDNITRYVLWHNLVADTPELAGYPTQFLVDRLQDLWTTSSSDDDTLIGSINDDRPDNVDVRILPVLDAFKFESQGGLVGSCYGMEGIADGTRIQTTPVFNVQATVHQGYLRTEDGSVLYELGQPLVAAEEMDDTAQQFAGLAKKAAAQVTGYSNNKNKDDMATTDEGGPDADIIRLGGLSALAIVGGMAVTSLLDHLTVTVFWV